MFASGLLEDLVVGELAWQYVGTSMCLLFILYAYLFILSMLKVLKL